MFRMQSIYQSISGRFILSWGPWLSHPQSFDQCQVYFLCHVCFPSHETDFKSHQKLTSCPLISCATSASVDVSCLACCVITYRAQRWMSPFMIFLPWPSTFDLALWMLASWKEACRSVLAWISMSCVQNVWFFFTRVLMYSFDAQPGPIAIAYFVLGVSGVPLSNNC